MNKKILIILLIVCIILASTGWYRTYQKTIIYEERNASLLWNSLTDLHGSLYSISEVLSKNEMISNKVFEIWINKDAEAIHRLKSNIGKIELINYDIRALYSNKLLGLELMLKELADNNVQRSFLEEGEAFKKTSEWLGELLYEKQIGVKGMFLESNHKMITDKLDELIDEIEKLAKQREEQNNEVLSDIWIQNLSKDPIEVVKSAIENQIDKDYTISVKFIKAVIDDKETQRKIDSYKGSELAESRGWSDMYLMDHFLIVKANYFVEYDHEKTFMNDGNLEQYFYLTRDTDTGLWSIIDNSSSERTFKDSGEVYKNEEYGFAFKIPNNWEGKYKIEESEGENYNRVSFLYTGYEYEDGSFQEFFSITIYDEKTFNEYENKNEELILATDEGNVFYSSTPLDSGIDNEEAAEEYTNLNINHVKVKELFSID